MISSRFTSTNRGRSIFTLACILSLALISACSAPGGSSSQTKAPTTIRVMMDEWTIKPNPASVAAGPVTFEVTNQGAIEHELIVLKTDLAPTSLKMRAAEDRVDEGASGENLGEVELAAGKTGSLSIDLPAGRYVLLCNLLIHYKQGMVTSFEVK